jgi:calmodulin
MSLSQEEISNFKEVFSLFDKDDDGLVQLSDLPLMIRSQNLYPTKEELNVMIAELKQEGNENIDFPEYVSLLTK